MSGPSIYLDKLRLRHLRLLELIEKKHSLRSVAEEINLTQPAVSQMVKDLEFAFGTRLVIRSAQGAKLTPPGQHALHRLRAGLATLDQLATELVEESQPVLRIGCNPLITYRLLPAALETMDILNTNLNISVTTGQVGEMMAQVIDGNQDCYIGRVEWENVPVRMASLLHITPLSESHLTVACSVTHPLAGDKPVAPRDLLKYPWALTSPTTSNRHALDTSFRNCGLIPPKPIVEITTDPNALIGLAQHLPILICIPHMSIVHQPEGLKIAVLNTPKLHMTPIAISMVTLKETDTLPAMSVLRAALQRAASQAPQ